MSYAALYEFVQTQNELPIRRKAFLDKVAELTGVPAAKVIMSGLEHRSALGYFVSPNNQDHPFIKQTGGDRPVIVVARGLNRCWQRFVMLKELMHCFDTGLQLVGSGQDFSALLEEFVVPLPDRSMAMESEVRGFWMALSLFCPEARRQELLRLRDQQAMSDLDIATEIRLPEAYIPNLFDPNYKAIVTSLMVG